MNRTVIFYGLQPRWTGWDRLFKIYALPDAIAGAYIAGQVYDEASGRAQLIAPAGILGLFMVPWVRRMVRRRQEREASYASLDPGSDEFLAVDSRNFVIERADVEHVTIRRRRALWTWGATNSGTIEFALWGGVKRRFILIGEQDTDGVARALHDSFGSDSVTDEGASKRIAEA